MLYQKQPTYPIISKMNKDSENATIELRKFKKTGLELIQTYQIKNVINPLLADHLTREAEHFLFMIHVLEQRLKQKQIERFLSLHSCKEGVSIIKICINIGYEFLKFYFKANVPFSCNATPNQTY
ncbi:hypothetical protein CN887_02860 [Bacillus pseudomycoides]|nr:hypothetical protein CN887_02860 [Bacillus pseudomycoides]PHG31017.1 hypothetical protein COI43_14595 [Bacillus pseudomycoides]